MSRPPVSEVRAPTDTVGQMAQAFEEFVGSAAGLISATVRDFGAMADKLGPARPGNRGGK